LKQQYQDTREVLDLTKTVKEREDTIASLEERIDALQEELGELKENIEEYRSKMVEKSGVIGILESENGALKVKLRQMIIIPLPLTLRHSINIQRDSLFWVVLVVVLVVTVVFYATKKG
jgi:predicted RNase H-like nuclease (RuvC/YqgF family)